MAQNWLNSVKFARPPIAPWNFLYGQVKTLPKYCFVWAETRWRAVKSILTTTLARLTPKQVESVQNHWKHHRTRPPQINHDSRLVLRKTRAYRSIDVLSRLRRHFYWLNVIFFVNLFILMHSAFNDSVTLLTFEAGSCAVFMNQWKCSYIGCIASLSWSKVRLTVEIQ